MDQTGQTLATKGNFQNLVSLAGALADMRATIRGGRQDRVRVKNTPFLQYYPPYSGTAADDVFFNSPKLLVPANKNRISLIISQVMLRGVGASGHYALYSFGYPQFIPGAFNQWGLVIPGFLLNTTLFPTQAGNGSIAIDDIWVTLVKGAVRGPALVTAGYVIAYEGTLAIEGGNNQLGRAA